MGIAPTIRPAARNEIDPLPADPPAGNPFAWAAPLAEERNLLSGLVVLVIAAAALLVSVLS